jgi:predicted  nucleic acid-binding Zn-ribbon protein
MERDRDREPGSATATPHSSTRRTVAVAHTQAAGSVSGASSVASHTSSRQSILQQGQGQGQGHGAQGQHLPNRQTTIVIGGQHSTTAHSVASSTGTHKTTGTGTGSNIATGSKDSSDGKVIISNRIDQLMASELATAQKLLAIQQKDNYKFQEHVQMLDGEIDALKEVLERKQLLINRKESEIDAKCEQVRNLEMELKAARLDIASFTTLADNFRSLQHTLENKHIEIDALTLRLSQFEKSRAEMEAYWAQKVDEGLKTEAHLTASVCQLTNQLADLSGKKFHADGEIEALKTRVSNLQVGQQALSFVNRNHMKSITYHCCFLARIEI